MLNRGGDPDLWPVATGGVKGAELFGAVLLLGGVSGWPRPGKAITCEGGQAFGDPWGRVWGFLWVVLYRVCGTWVGKASRHLGEFLPRRLSVLSLSWRCRFSLCLLLGVPGEGRRRAPPCPEARSSARR